MVKYLTLLVLVSLWVIQPVQTGQASSPVAHIDLPGAGLLSFTGMIRNNDIQLKWIVTQNELVDRFELEKSTDKKKFSMAALVFCTEAVETDYYQFIDRLTGKKVFYRIKIINKDGTVSYSSALEIDPSAKPEPIEQTKTTTHDIYC